MTLHQDTELRHSLDILRTRWRLIGGIGVLATVVAMCVPAFTGTLYEVSTTITVEVRGRIEDGDVNTVAEYWRSEAVLGEALSRLGLRSLYSYAAAHTEVEAEDQGLRLIIRARNSQEGRAIGQMLAAKLIADHQRRRNLLLRTREELRAVMGELRWEVRVLKRAAAKPSVVKRFFRRRRSVLLRTQEGLRAAIGELWWQVPALKRAIAATPSVTWIFRGRATSGGIDPDRAFLYPDLMSSRQAALASYGVLLTEVERHLSELMATQIRVESPRVAPLSPLPPALQRFLAAAALGVVAAFAVGLVAGQPHRLLTRDASDTIQPFFA